MPTIHEVSVPVSYLEAAAVVGTSHQCRGFRSLLAESHLEFARINFVNCAFRSLSTPFLMLKIANSAFRFIPSGGILARNSSAVGMDRSFGSLASTAGRIVSTPSLGEHKEWDRVYFQTYQA